MHNPAPPIPTPSDVPSSALPPPAGRSGVPVFQLLFFRNMLVLLLTIPALVAGGVASPWGNRRRLLALRGLIGFGAGATMSVPYPPALLHTDSHSTMHVPAWCLLYESLVSASFMYSQLN